MRTRYLGKASTKALTSPARRGSISSRNATRLETRSRTTITAAAVRLMILFKRRQGGVCWPGVELERGTVTNSGWFWSTGLLLLALCSLPLSAQVDAPTRPTGDTLKSEIYFGLRSADGQARPRSGRGMPPGLVVQPHGERNTLADLAHLEHLDPHPWNEAALDAGRGSRPG